MGDSLRQSLSDENIVAGRGKSTSLDVSLFTSISSNPFKMKNMSVQRSTSDGVPSSPLTGPRGGRRGRRRGGGSLLPSQIKRMSEEEREDLKSILRDDNLIERAYNALTDHSVRYPLYILYILIISFLVSFRGI